MSIRIITPGIVIDSVYRGTCSYCGAVIEATGEHVAPGTRKTFDGVPLVPGAKERVAFTYRTDCPTKGCKHVIYLEKLTPRTT